MSHIVHCTCSHSLVAFCLCIHSFTLRYIHSHIHSFPSPKHLSQITFLTFIHRSLLINLLLILYSDCQSSLSAIFVLSLSFTLIHYDSLSLKRFITKIYIYVRRCTYIQAFCSSCKIALLLCCTFQSEATIYQYYIVNYCTYGTVYI